MANIGDRELCSQTVYDYDDPNGIFMCQLIEGHPGPCWHRTFIHPETRRADGLESALVSIRGIAKHVHLYSDSIDTESIEKYMDEIMAAVSAARHIHGERGEAVEQQEFRA